MRVVFFLALTAQCDIRREILDGTSEDAIQLVCRLNWKRMHGSDCCSKTNITVHITCDTSCALAACPRGWEEFDEFCFGFGGDTLTWFDAAGEIRLVYVLFSISPRIWNWLRTYTASACGLLGARLVRIDSEKKNDWLVNQLKTRKFWHTWIGGQRIYGGDWEWIPSFKPIKAYTNWGPGEPHNVKEEMCIDLSPAYDFKWIDVRCKNEFRFVCEKSNKPKN